MSDSNDKGRKLRFVMVGGFLGAGKTTTIAALARKFQARGQKVGIVTNDQATDLVDTNVLRSQGFEVGEVAGACFCCNFNELTATVDRLSAAERPDVILAEPVGSCTDLVATVVQPLLQLFQGQFEVAPYGVILKPSHGLKILRNEPGGGFSPKAEYIFRKQLEEADAVFINRIDELSLSQREELQGLVSKQFPGTPMLQMSAKTGVGIDAVFDFIDQRGVFGRRILELDYDVYAEGEAELGWLNASLIASASAPFDLDALLVDIVGRLRASLADEGAEVAHLKTIGLSDVSYGVANLISSDSAPELSLPSKARVKEANVVVNARVAIDPAQLETHVRKAVGDATAALGVNADFRQMQRFRPGRPVPTHRLAAAAT